MQTTVIQPAVDLMILPSARTATMVRELESWAYLHNGVVCVGGGGSGYMVGRRRGCGRVREYGGGGGGHEKQSMTLFRT